VDLRSTQLWRSILKNYVVCALYKFTRLNNHESIQAPLLNLMLSHRVRGTLLLATEGINGTISGSRDDVHCVLDWLREIPELCDLDCKESQSDEQPFKRSTNSRSNDRA